MSFICEAVLMFPDYAEFREKVVLPLPFDGDRGQSFGLIGTGAAGGHKVFCEGLAAAAFNYIDLYALIDWFYETFGDHAATMWLDQEGSRYVVVSGDNPRWPDDNTTIITKRPEARVVPGELAPSELTP